ncbi:SsgA family sporulation/cell division regulator [Amycolatopsis roodepoortensis]|uniref:SsgA family sporulation/cell division regulator n=1 Tax=Amycolatopsis roodepoortensis TaxID=700274 RepID=UPI00214BFFCA|nr:SsgA family sporulation/cell division regulator [Amycolatopsis roodepoortensis]UUV29116.1 SsgA family sporulation/cell division regulator [Amycolatopsis roodepoortensis]
MIDAREVSFFTAAQLIVRKISGAAIGPEARRITIEWRYDRTDPWAIRMHMPALEAEYRFARELLDRGRIEPTGADGRVFVQPLLSQWVEITLRCNCRKCPAFLFSFDHSEIDNVIDATELLVPLGAEADQVDEAAVDAELARIASGAA